MRVTHVGAGRRLVEQHERGTVQQRDRGVQPAPLAARELRRRAGRAAASRPSASATSSMRAAASARAQAREARRRTAGCRGRGAGGTRRCPAARCRSAGARPAATRTTSIAAHLDPPGVGPAQPGDDRHERRLARAVGPEQAEDRAGLHPEVDAGERDRRAVRLRAGPRRPAPVRCRTGRYAGVWRARPYPAYR